MEDKPASRERYFSFKVPGEVKGQGRPRATIRAGHATVYERAEDKSYKGLIQFHAVKAMEKEGIAAVKPDGEGIYVYAFIYVAIPKSMSRAKRGKALNGDIRPQRKPDLDNVIKAVLDAMNGVVYRDDKEVTSVYLRREYSDMPHLEVTVGWTEEAEE